MKRNDGNFADNVISKSADLNTLASDFSSSSVFCMIFSSSLVKTFAVGFKCSARKININLLVDLC